MESAPRPPQPDRSPEEQARREHLATRGLIITGHSHRIGEDIPGFGITATQWPDACGPHSDQALAEVELADSYGEEFGRDDPDYLAMVGELKASMDRFFPSAEPQPE